MEVRFTIREHTKGFNTEATGWLRVYVNMELLFRALGIFFLEKARKAEDRV